MTAKDDIDLKEWTGDWQAAPYDVQSAEQIRRYVAHHTGLLWSFAVADFVIGGIALPVLVYIGVTTEQDVERFAMAGLASLTIAAVMFGWWNKRGVLRSSATTIADYVAISVERLHRMRQAWQIGWLVLTVEVVVFTVWVWNRLYSGPGAPSAGAERFAWSWLSGFTLIAIVGLIVFRRWIDREARRFDELRRELEADATATRPPAPATAP
jgi:hypothetical protein